MAPEIALQGDAPGVVVPSVGLSLTTGNIATLAG
jgi:hypothetical protein